MFYSARDGLRERRLKIVEEEADENARPLRVTKAELEQALVSTDSESEKEEIKNKISHIQKKIESCYISYGRYLMKENV
ncbi:putative uncharacterized phage protein [Moritella viscosa]|nr:hypothetical protein [Moritella viscosa]CED59836.1 putative uncharacterized phage protein [Moritella viscosa]